MADDVKIVPEPPISAVEMRERALLAGSRHAARGFLEFIRERGVMGLAIGFVLGTSVQKVVTALVTDIINPFISIFLGRTANFKDFSIGNFLIGDFISSLIDFLILAAVIYFVFKALRLEKLDKPKA